MMGAPPNFHNYLLFFVPLSLAAGPYFAVHEAPKTQ